MIEYFNGVLGRVLVAILEKEDKRIWERGLSDFLIGYGGLRYVLTGRSFYELLIVRLMRFFWKFCVMFRFMISDNQSVSVLEEYMVKMQVSLQVLYDSVKDVIFERQIKNMREYNLRRAVQIYVQADSFRVDDFVWVRNVNLRKNKLENQYS